ncbi:MAG: Hpt domain-containing protein [Porticoccaceae bacterium]|nr:Hpt domain-containing protein [Porticoccaceae bacterium]
MVDTKQNVWGLEWLIDEVETSLHEAYSGLEAYLHDDSNAQQLQFCLSHLHQVSGSLKIVACHGGVLLVEEMESLVRSMIDGSITDVAESSELLVNAILKVPAYLRQILSNRRDEPAILLTLLNDLRALRNHPLATETSLFNPNFDFMAAVPANISPGAQRIDAVVGLVKKLRQIYQFALLGVLKKQELEKNIGFLQKVTTRLQELFANSQRQQLWRTAGAILQSINPKEPAISAAQRHLFWELDKELRAIIQHGGAAFDAALPEGLLRNLLYYVLIIKSANGASSSELIDALCDDFKLSEALPRGVMSMGDSGLTPTYDRAVMETLSSSLGDELDIIKEVLESHLEASSAPAEAVGQITTGLKKISDTLAIAGYAPARQTALTITSQLAAYGSNQQASRAELTPIVSNVVLLENVLKAWPLQGDDDEATMDDAQQTAYMLGSAQQALVAEVHNSIEQVKDAIVGYISSRNDKQHLQEVPRLLNEMQRAMAIIDYRRLAEIIKSCGSYVSKELIRGTVPPQWQDIDALADSIISVEYYLDSLGSAETDDSEKILLTAEQKLSALGYTPQPVPQSTTTTPVASSKTATSDESSSEASNEEAPLLTEAVTVADEVIEASLVEPDTLESDSVDSTLELESVSPTSVVTQTSESTSETELEFESAVEASTTSEPGRTHTALDEFSLDIPQRGSSAPAASSNTVVETEPEVEELATGANADTSTDTTTTESPAQPADEDEIDPEIREIFVEEAREVLDSLQEYMPEWINGNADALPDIRRAFHTLKGSGRMVNAMVIGELGWAIENVLNKIVEGRLTQNDDVNGLIERALHIIPDMVTEFEQAQPHGNLEFIEALQNSAECIARGEAASLPPLPGEAPTADAATDTSFLAELSAEPQPEIFATEPDELLVDDLEADTDLGFSLDADADADADANIDTETEQNFEFDQASLSELDAALGLDQTDSLESEIENAPVDPVDPVEDDALSVAFEAKSLQATAVEIPEDSTYDETLLAIFADEADNYLDVMSSFITESQTASPFFSVPPNTLLRALHTLKGSAHMSGVTFVAEIATHLDHLMNEMSDRQVAMDDNIIVLLDTATAQCRDAIPAMQQARRAVEPEGFGELTQQIAELTARVQAKPLKKSANEAMRSDQALRGLMTEGMHHSLGADEMLDVWLFEPEALQQQQPEMVAELQDIAAAAKEAQLPTMQALCNLLVQVYDRIGEHQVLLTNDTISNLNDAHNLLLNMFDAVAAYQDIPDFPAELQTRLQASASAEIPIEAALPYLNGTDDADTDEVATLSGISNDLTEILDDLPVELESPELHSSLSSAQHDDLDSFPLSEPFEPEALKPETLEPEPPAPAAATPQEPEAQTAAPEAEAPEEDIDEELVAIFLEEADDLNEEVEAALVQWKENPRSRQPIDVLKRALHTLKGGARMTGCRALGDLCHDFETDVIKAEPRRDQLDPDFFNAMLKRYDQLHSELEQIKTGAPSGGFVEPIDDPEAAYSSQSQTEDQSERTTEVTEPGAADEAPQHNTAEVLPFAPPITKAPAATKALTPSAPAQQKTAVQTAPNTGGLNTGNKPRFGEPQETIKIAAPMLDALANLAGETSITRGRVEQQINQFHFSLDEMDATIARLQDQIRRLGSETEAQITYRQGQIESSQEEEGFDPLEMDRYSDLQQLTRALQESASDLQDLKETLVLRARDAETVLVQQSRIQHDLQENLMQTRMVPFSRLVPRLRRIVRQVSGELNKIVDFKLEGVDGEMDRTVLEKIVPPLEHLIRNAIDHGVETPEQREQAGKAGTGKVFLDFSREAGDIVIRLADDGNGINLPAIRARAIKQKLLTEDSQISDQELMQFIFQPGFSTSETVSQVSGRGVGMDVVNNDIHQLGGTVSINSKPGAGTEFVLRLPFTVSVNRALMIRNSGERYAILLNSINGVVNVGIDELANFYANPSSRLHYGGEQYQILYLGSLLQGLPAPSLDSFVQKASLVLLSGERANFAVHIDVLEASQEVVVKSLGTQFSNVMGLSGVTVLGDGKVVAILDLRSLLRERDLSLSVGATAQLALDVDSTPETGVAASTPNVEIARDEQKETTVMIVDDSVTVRKVTTRFLEREGYRVITAKDGVDALQVLQEETPDLMLLDIEMPRMDGFEVARQVRSSERLQDLPIIMITSRTGDKHREKAMSIGVNHYMGKPYQEEVLLSVIKDSLV